MDMDTSRTLTKVLGKRDMDKIPPDILKKLEKYCENSNDIIIQTKVLYNTTQKNIEKMRKEYEKLLSQQQDTKAKNDAAQVNVTELRHQLDTANAEIARLTKQVSKQESETINYRKERNELIDEKDQILKASDGKDTIINRLQLDIKSLEEQLQSAVSEKSDAIARFAEMAAKEQSLEDREKRMEKEIERLNVEIVTLTSNFNQKISELSASGQDNTSATVQLQNELKAAMDELRVANLTISQLEESNQLLASQCDGESVSLRDQLKESVTLMEYYKQELDAKIKLTDLYKASFDDCQAQVTQLTADATNLREILKESTEKCDLLESKLKGLEEQHRINLNAKDEKIAKLKDELKEASNLLKTAETDTAEKVLEKMFPRAAAANSLLKNNSSLTDIYSCYHNTLDDVRRLEVECRQLNMKLECSTLQLQETSSEYERQQIEYKNVLKVNEEMNHKLNEFVAGQDSVREKLLETSSKYENVQRENAQLKCNQKDLARQICNLLNKMETGANESNADQQQFKRMGLSSEAISKELITFDNIVEMQENNQKLILKVGELSNKLKKMEEINIGLKCYEVEVTNLERRLCDAEQFRRANEDLLAMSLKQKERFKQLYYDAMKDMCKEPIKESEGVALKETTTIHTTSTDGKDKKLSEVEQKLQERIKELKTLKEEYNEYRKENSINFNILNEQYETVERKVRELHSVNSQLQSQANFANEQIKSHQKDIAIYKKQIQTLEDRNQMYDKTISKHEAANKSLRDEILSTIQNLSSAENRCEYLERECRRLIESNNNIEIENKALHRQKMTQSILQSNLELIKISSERSDFEGRVQMEKQLEDQVRQSKALGRKLEEDQNRFREESESLKRQNENAVKKMKDELAQSDALRSKLTEAREQVESKNQQIKNLSEKLQEALTPCKSDNPIAKGNKKIKDLELQVKSKTAEIDQLRTELQDSTIKIQEFVKQKSDWEDESKALKENYEKLKATFTSDLQASRLNETNLKSQIEELQQEIRLQLSSSHSKVSDAVTQSKVQAELKEALHKITENNKELRQLRTECHKLKENLRIVESKYAKEMLAHSSDLQALTLRKDELNKCQEQMYQFRLAKDEAVEILKSSQMEWEAINKKETENRKELESKVSVLEAQNVELLDVMQAQNIKLSGTSDDSIANSSIINRSLTDEEFKEISSEKIFNVVKYMRREKDIAVTRIEILNIENTRLSAELEIQNKRINELNAQLISSKTPASVTDVASTAKYEDLMRKMETFNAVTDSNIHLRAEKDDLLNKVQNLSEKITKLEADLLPLQEKNREMSEKNEEKSKENNMLRSNVDKLRQKVSDLVERNNKNPEDFKRLQHERESLAKMLTNEKENLRQVNEELNLMKAEKNRLEQDVATKTKQLQTTTDDRKKLQDELNNFKQTNVRLTLEIIEIKSTILKKEDELKAIQNDLSSKESQLTESRNKEMQIRRIAKKYKDLSVELKTKEDEREATKSDDPTAGSSGNRPDNETTHELSSRLSALQEEINELRKENENLKKHDENQIITDARNRITTLTEANRQLNRDYQTSKSQLQTCEQSRSEHGSVVNALKIQLETKIKELLDQDAAKQETIVRLTRENETLNTRVNQLHRQFQQHGSKPTTSSGTIEKSSSDPARTANVKPMATPNTQSASVSLRRGGDTPLASIRPMSVQNSRTAAVHPTSQTSNVVVQGSSTGSVTALVPPQQQVHTTGNTSTAEAMSSSPTSSHTDYIPATSSAIVAVPPMESTSAESTQEAESLTVNTNESSSSSSSTSTHIVLQQQIVALVSPRVELTPQNILATSQQVIDQNQAASSSFLTAMSSSHHQASSSNTVTTTQAGSHKRPRDAEGDSSTGVEESSASEKTSPQNKRTRLGEQTFQGVSESGLDVEYQVPTSSQRDQEDDVVAVDSEDDDDEGMDDEATADVDEAFDAENGDTDEIESFGQEAEGRDIQEVRNDDNEVDVDVDDSSNAPNQSSSVAASSGSRVNLVEIIELSPSGQETQQIQTISSGSDAGPSGQGNIWRQVQSPVRQQQQQSLVIQQTYEEIGDDSIVPSTPNLYVARRADGFSEAISSPHPTVPHASRFTFGDSGAAAANRTIEGMDDTRIDLNVLDGAGDGGQSSSSNSQVNQSEIQQVINVVDSVDESANLNKNPDEPMAGPSSQVHGITPQLRVDAKNRKADDASTTQTGDVSVDVESVDGGNDTVSSEGEKASVPKRPQDDQNSEAEASVLLPHTRSRGLPRGRGDAQRQNPVTYHQGDNNYGRYIPMPHHQQRHGNPHRGGQTRGSPVRGARGRPRRSMYPRH